MFGSLGRFQVPRLSVLNVGEKERKLDSAFKLDEELRVGKNQTQPVNMFYSDLCS
jgi:hypothetical protein